MKVINMDSEFGCYSGFGVGSKLGGWVGDIF